MSALSELLTFSNKRLLKLGDAEFLAFDRNAKARLLSDYNVGQVWSHDGVHYLVPNPPSSTREVFHALRAAWQQESSTE